MLWTLIMFLCLRKLRRDNPSMFDPALALESVNAAVAETAAEMGL